MQVTIKQARSESLRILSSYGFSKQQALLTTNNIIEAELVGKPSHGLVRLPAIKDQLEKGSVSLAAKDFEVLNESANHLHIDGRFLPGFYLMYKSLEIALSKAQGKIFSVGIKDGGYASGYIGAYAREAAENNMIFIGFNNSTGWTVPYGSTKGTWGTNPVTVGIPATHGPIIFDAASTKISIGDILVAKSSGKKIKDNAAMDKDGNITTDPMAAYEGRSVLPIADHKGSGLAYVVELLAGALTGSRVGYSVPGGWGSFYILLDPTIFRALEDFKNDVAASIEELKSLPKKAGVVEIFYPGEQSLKLRKKHMELGSLEINDQLWETLRRI